MALTRKMLEAMGIEAEKIESIIEAHAETVNGIKKERDDYKARYESVDTSEDWKSKYDEEHAAFEAYRSETENRDSIRAKESAFKAILTAAGVADKYAAKIVKMSGEAINALTLDGDGNAVGFEKLVDDAKTEWGDFVPQITTQGAPFATPPQSAPVKMTKEQIMGIKDAAERQRAIAENLDVFGYQSTTKG